MSEFQAPYVAPFDEERRVYKAQRGEIVLTPWVIQNAVYELVVNHMVMNSPQTMGYPFKQKFDLDKNKSEIFVDIAFRWDTAIVNKRPAIFINRGRAEYKYPTFKAGGRALGTNFEESETGHAAIVTMPLQVKCIATNVGFVETLADYIKWPLMAYQAEIQEDFQLRQFRVRELTPPEIYVESKEHFVVILNIATAFDEGWIVKGDDLKIKRISRTIFDKLSEKPFESQ